MLRKERDREENNYRKAIAIAMQQKQDDVSLKRAIVELCSKPPDMQLEPEASNLDNV